MLIATISDGSVKPEPTQRYTYEYACALGNNNVSYQTMQILKNSSCE